MAVPNGYKSIRRAVITALKTGNYQHVARDGVDGKNLLLIGVVTADEVVAIIRRSDGSHHASSPLHQDRSITCHLIKAEGWYVKFYFIDPATFFISVHQQGLS